MTTIKLSGRAWTLLLLIDSHCTPDGRFWVPSAYPEFCEYLHRYLENEVSVSGAGDAKILKSLEAKGLIEPRKVSRYSYAITEEGRMLIETSLDNGSIPIKLNQEFLARRSGRMI